ncbi:hypothetical protein ACFE04_022672 [Oxalis oulophora]
MVQTVVTAAAMPADATSYNTVFIDTSIDTHMVMNASDSDIVSHFKDKIVREHKLCFPDIGHIGINSLKVKRNGVFYHLSDHMILRTAFSKVSETWILSVDVDVDVDVDVERKDDERGKDQIPCISQPEKLLAIMSNHVVDAVDFLPMKEKSNADQFGSVFANGEALEDFAMVELNTTNSGSNVAILQSEKNPQPTLSEDYDQHSKEFEDQQTSVGQKEVSFTVPTVNEPLEGAAHIQSVDNEKHEITKKNEDVVDGNASKDNDALQTETALEFSSGNVGGEVSHIVGNEDQSIAGEFSKTSSLNVNKSDNREYVVDHENNILKSKIISVQTENAVNESSVPETTTKRKRKAKGKDGSENTAQPQAENLSSGPPAKKKRKTENKNLNEKSSKENQAVVIDTAEQLSVEVERINESIVIDSSIAAAPGVANAFMSGPTKLKRKRQRGSSNLVDKDSKNDVEGESSIVTVRKYDAALAVGAISIKPKEKHADNDNDNDGNMQVETVTHGTEAMNVDDRLVLAANEPESIETDFGISRQENDEHNKSKNQPDRVEELELSKSRVEEVELSKSNDPMSVDASNLLDANEIKTSSKKKRKSKKVKDQVSEKSIEEENIMKPTKEVETKTSQASVLTNDREKTDDMSENPVDVEHVKEKSRKKKKKGDVDIPGENNETVNIDNVGEKTMVEENIMLSTDGTETKKLEDTSQETVRDKTRKKKKKKHGSAEKAQPEVIVAAGQTKDSLVDNSLSEPHKAKNNDHLSEKPKGDGNIVHTDKETDNVIRNVLESLQQVDENAANVKSLGDKARKKKKKLVPTEIAPKELQKVMTNINDIVNANDQEVNVSNVSMRGNDPPVTAESDVLSFHKFFKLKEPNNELNSKKNMNKVDKHENGPLTNLQSLTKSAAGSGSSEAKRSLSGVKDGNVKLQSSKKLVEVSKNQPKPPQSGKPNSAIQEVKRPNVFSAPTKTDLKKHKESSSGSSSESSKRIVNRKNEHELDSNHKNASGRKTFAKEVVNRSEGKKKRLLALSGKIVNEQSEGSSKDEDHSDASTQAPSDHSASSDNSDEESDADFNSPDGSPYRSKVKTGGDEDVGETNYDGTEGMSLSQIIRSSVRYKKAKLTASQLDDSESQPIPAIGSESQAVPDSQPI